MTQPLRFGVLGPLVVWHENECLELGPPRQKAVLTALLLAPGKIISMDRLIDMVWVGAPPAKPAESLHSYLSNLRRLLEPTRPSRERDRILRRDPPGYRLVVEPEQIDAWLFEQELREGRRMLTHTRYSRASRHIEDCLRLWRDSPYQEISGIPAAEQERVRLEELRLVALETRYEARLARHRELDVSVAELQALATRMPTRQRLAQLLMLTLCQLGRRADAVQVYDQTRSALAEQLGLAPNSELQQLFVTLLHQDVEVVVERDEGRE